MEAKGMASPEGIRPRHGISGISAPPQERIAAPVREPEVRPAPVSPEPKKGKEKKGIGKRAKMFLAGTAVAAILGGGYGAYETIPQVHSAINRVIPGLGSGEETSTDPQIFEFGKNGAVVTEQNTIGIPPEEIGQLDLKVKSPNPDALTPMQGVDERSTSSFYISSEPIVELPLPFEVPPNVDIKVGEEFTRLEGYKVTINGLPKDTVIYAPFAGKYSFSQTVNMSGTSCFAGLDFLDNDGYYRRLVFQFGVSKSLIPEEIAPKKTQGKYTWFQENIEVKAGDPLFSLDKKDARGNWLPHQLTIGGAFSTMNANGEPIRDKNDKVVVIFAPIKIMTIDNKAVSIIK